MPRYYLKTRYPEVFRRYQTKSTTHQVDEDAVLLPLPNGQLMCLWAPTWTSDVSEALLDKYMHRTCTINC